MCSGGLYSLTRGGQHLGSVYHDCLNDMRSAAAISSSHSRHGPTHIAIGSHGSEDSEPKFYNFDIRREAALVTMPTDSAICSIALEGKSLITGSESGEICLRDSRNLQVQARVQGHSGGVTMLDVKDGLVASCGFSVRHNNYKVDNMVNIYDVRRMLSAVAQVPFMAGPQLLKFHPTYTGTLCVASASGQFSMMDVARLCACDGAQSAAGAW